MAQKSKKNKHFKLDPDFFDKEMHGNDFMPKTLHAKTLVSEKILVANDNALPVAYREMAELAQNSSHFLGYPFLEELSKNPLISAGVETIADEMTKKFIKIIYEGDNNKENGLDIAVEDKIKFLKKEFRKYNIPDLFRKCAEKIGYYGGCLVYVDTGEKDPELLKSPLILDPATFKQGSLKCFTVIDPISVSPGLYNSTDPTRADYFKPQTWYVIDKEIHSSRLLYFAGKEAPLLQKPAYNFFGVSTAQIAFEYVTNFEKNRDSGSELLNKFSVSIFKTNMQEALGGESYQYLEDRLKYFIHHRHNDGVFMIDKESEDFVKAETPLSGVTDIIRQSLELIAAVFRIPAVKYLGISPSGFNATGESDLENFHSMITSLQEKQFADNVENVLKILQLNHYGDIDEYVGFEFEPLNEEDNKIKAEVDKIKADTHAVLLDRNVISPEESRTILAKDNEGIMNSIDADNTDFMNETDEQEYPDLGGLNFENQNTAENAL